jgi:hypothetical protein
MAAGCPKADRCRNSSSHKRYNAENRADTHKGRNTKREEKRQRYYHERIMAVPHGTARAARRKQKQIEWNKKNAQDTTEV